MPGSCKSVDVGREDRSYSTTPNRLKNSSDGPEIVDAMRELDVLSPKLLKRLK